MSRGDPPHALPLDRLPVPLPERRPASGHDPAINRRELPLSRGARVATKYDVKELRSLAVERSLPDRDAEISRPRGQQHLETIDGSVEII
jgi:hypothetical protein